MRPGLLYRAALEGATYSLLAGLRRMVRMHVLGALLAHVHAGACCLMLYAHMHNNATCDGP